MHLILIIPNKRKETKLIPVSRVIVPREGEKILYNKELYQVDEIIYDYSINVVKVKLRKWTKSDERMKVAIDKTRNT